MSLVLVLVWIIEFGFLGQWSRSSAFFGPEFSLRVDGMNDSSCPCFIIRVAGVSLFPSLLSVLAVVGSVVELEVVGI